MTHHHDTDRPVNLHGIGVALIAGTLTWAVIAAATALAIGAFR